MKRYKSVQFYKIFRMSSNTAQT